MRRAINELRPVAVPRAQVREAMFAEFLATMGASESEIKAARGAMTERAVEMNPTTDMKE